MLDTNHREIREFLEENKPPNVTVVTIEVDTDLISSGVIDSFGVVAFIEFLEETYGIQVSDEDIDPDNFRTVNSISNFVERARRANQ